MAIASTRLISSIIDLNGGHLPSDFGRDDLVRLAEGILAGDVALSDNAIVQIYSIYFASAT